MDGRVRCTKPFGNIDRCILLSWTETIPYCVWIIDTYLFIYKYSNMSIGRKFLNKISRFSFPLDQFLIKHFTVSPVARNTQPRPNLNYTRVCLWNHWPAAVCKRTPNKPGFHMCVDLHTGLVCGARGLSLVVVRDVLIVNTVVYTRIKCFIYTVEL